MEFFKSFPILKVIPISANNAEPDEMQRLSPLVYKGLITKQKK